MALGRDYRTVHADVARCWPTSTSTASSSIGSFHRRHKVQSRGTRSFPAQEIFGTYGVLRLRRVHLGPLPYDSLARDPMPDDLR